MSERFVVPEPSRDAVDALRDTKLRSHSFDEVKAMASLVLRVDVPGIVKAEVARALRYECRLDDSTVSLRRFDREQAAIRIAAYLESRFGEPVPESHCPNADCKYVAGHSGRHMGRDGIEFGADAPGVPRTDPIQLHPRNPDGSVGRNIRCEGCGVVTANNGAHVCFESCVIAELDSMERPKSPSAPALTIRPEGKVLPGVPVVFTKAERATLQRLERFCEALARDITAPADFPVVTITKRVQAAHTFLRGRSSPLAPRRGKPLTDDPSPPTV